MATLPPVVGMSAVLKLSLSHAKHRTDRRDLNEMTHHAAVGRRASL